MKDADTLVSDLLSEFDERVRRGDGCSWNNYLAEVGGTTNVAGELLPDLIRIEAEHREWDAVWVNRQLTSESISGDHALVARLLRGLYCDQVDCGRRPCWSSFAQYHIPAETMDLRTFGEPIPLGVAVGQRYLVEQRIGAGSLGVVYSGRDAIEQKQVALKAGWQRFARERDLTGRLIREEARLLHAARGPGVPALYEVCPWQRCPVLIIEFIDGLTLAAQRHERGRLETAEAIRIVSEIGRIVERSHRVGHIHRDLKPENILLRRNGQVYVLDFGIGLREKTQFSDWVKRAGTIRYMAPEAIVQNITRLDGRADIWSLGVILMELLTDKDLFVDATKESVWVEAAAGVCVETVRDAKIDAQVKDVLTQCLAFEPANRFATMGALINALNNVGAST